MLKCLNTSTLPRFSKLLREKQDYKGHNTSYKSKHDHGIGVFQLIIFSLEHDPLVIQVNRHLFKNFIFIFQKFPHAFEVLWLIMGSDSPEEQKAGSFVIWAILFEK